ncbi:MAG: DUF177 domain-containing protein [Akkermansiaceae bacterium]|nr:DUF177 domain-containing protein [Armatimonadota bacterium]
MNPNSFSEAEGNESHSRFAYHNDLDPVEGGVKPVSESAGADRLSAKGERKPGRHSNGTAITAGTNGVPGAGDRRLDISEIARTVGQFYKHRFAIAARDGDELDLAEPITGEVTLTNTGAALILRGRAETILSMECARCLRPVLTPVETDIEEEFDLVAENSAWSSADDVQAVDADENGAVIKGNILDLGDLLRQYVLLAAPTRVECLDECDEIELPEGVTLKRIDDGGADTRASSAVDSPLKRLAELIAAKEGRAGETE